VAPEARAVWGKMSAPQMICHLNDSFGAVMGLKAVSPATGLVQRTFMKWGALYFPLPWPRGVATRPEVEQGVGGTPPGNFDDDRAELIARVERFCAARRDFEWHPHPIFGAMTDGQWMRWGYLHSDHHLRQFGA